MKTKLFILGSTLLTGCLFNQIKEEYRYKYFENTSVIDTIKSIFLGDTTHELIRYASDSTLFEYYFYQTPENVDDGDHGFRTSFVLPKQKFETELNYILGINNKVYLETLCGFCPRGFQKVIEGNVRILKNNENFISNGVITYSHKYFGIRKIEFSGIFTK